MPKMPKTPPPRNFSTWSPDRQQAWIDAMIATEQEQAAQGPMRGTDARTALNQMKRAEARRKMMEAQKPNRPAAPTTAQPPKQRPPSIGNTMTTMQEKRKYLESLKGGGAVKKKKVVAKMTPRKKPVAKPAARRGMGKAMRGR